MSIYITVAVEDVLSEEIVKKIFQHIGRFEITLVLQKRGFGYLKSKAQDFNRSAAGSPFLLLTDQDTPNDCPPIKIRSWLGNNVERHHNFLFRVAVMEVEAWLLADREKMTDFLRVPQSCIPETVDEIQDPKAHLISLAKRSRNSIVRRDLVPAEGTTAKVGPNYNPTLVRFIQEFWNPRTAENHSPSLHRTISRLNEFDPIC